MVAIPISRPGEPFEPRLDIEHMFPATRQVRIDTPPDEYRGPSEIGCRECHGHMIPWRSWPGGEPVNQGVVRQSADGRVGDEWRCFVCLRSVLVTWAARGHTAGTA